MAKDPEKVLRYKTQQETERQKKEMIRKMLFGPYEDSWRDEKGIVDNSDEAIASRLDIPISAASFHTASMLNEHFKRVTYLRNNNPWVLPSELEMLKLKPQYKK